MRVRGVTGWAAALVILVGLTTFGTSDFSQPRTTRAAIAPSGATSSVPINWSFSAAPQPAGEVTNHQFEDEGEEVGTPPTNHDFSSGLSGWTQTGTVSAEAGGPSGNTPGWETATTGAAQSLRPRSRSIRRPRR
jgi:hypothetical protein